MPTDGGSLVDIAELLRAVEDAPPVAAGDVLGERLVQVLGARAVTFLIADFSGQALFRLGGADRVAGTGGRDSSDAERVPLDGTPHGRALAEQRVITSGDGDGSFVFAPVTNRGEAIGVLELHMPTTPDAAMLEEIKLAAHAFAYITIANRRFTDLFDWGQRTVPLSLAAEIQHRLLPGTYTCEAGQFTLAAWLEPAGNIGGDTFDFSVDRDTLHLSMSDAMGHTVDAAVLATVLVGGLRNARRAGADLAEQAHVANAGLVDFARRGGGFATGQLVRVNLAAQSAEIINAGHPAPLRLRDGQVASVALEADPPFGVIEGQRFAVQPLDLLPGDRFVFVTDGMLERNAAGVDVAGVIAAGAQLHPREAVQHLVQSVLDATDDGLEDDATVMCLDWHGGPPRDRDSSAGAGR